MALKIKLTPSTMALKIKTDNIPSAKVAPVWVPTGDHGLKIKLTPSTMALKIKTDTFDHGT